MAPERVTILRGGAIGDFVLTLPAIAAMRAAYPRARLRLIGSPSILCLAHPDELLDHNSAALAPLYNAPGALPQATRSLFLETERLLAYAVDPEGLLRENLRELLADRATLHDPRPAPGVHIVDHLLVPVQHLGVPDPVPRITVRDSWAAGARALLQHPGSPLAILHPGSGGRRKRWPADRFLELARGLHERNVHTLLLHGPAEEDLVPLLERERPLSSICLRSPDLPELAGLLSLAGLFVGNDTGPAHIAASVGTPTVTLFGPTDPRVWAHPGARVIQAPGGDLSKLDVGPVLETALDALGASGP